MAPEVRIFVTMGAIPPFKKGLSKEERAQSESIVGNAIMEKNAPFFIDVFRQAKELGDVKLYACGLAMDVLGWELEDLEEGLFDDMVGITEFLGIAEGGEIMVI
ncbi:MAG: DsrE/DsrF/DrsH-like family protein [Persephonella sp.]|nr:DsrE/DsrF/DrsH-like family protein [Persephonella sp.]